MSGRLSRVLSALVAAALAVFAAPTDAAARAVPPATITLNYDVMRNGLQIAVMRERFESGEGRYRIASTSTAVGIAALIKPRPVTLTSAGRLTSDGLQPDRFEGSRGPDDPRLARADFDWRSGRLQLHHDGRQEDVRLSSGTQDRLSVMYQFMFHRYGGRQELRFPMTNGRKLEDYRYAIDGEMEIETPLGRMRTLHLVKQRESPDDTETEIWLAPEHRYLPVRVLIVESDGVRYEQLVTQLEIEP